MAGAVLQFALWHPWDAACANLQPPATHRLCWGGVGEMGAVIFDSDTNKSCFYLPRSFHQRGHSLLVKYTDSIVNNSAGKKKQHCASTRLCYSISHTHTHTHTHTMQQSCHHYVWCGVCAVWGRMLVHNTKHECRNAELTEERMR